MSRLVAFLTAALDTLAWSALFVPKGTPKAIVARLAKLGSDVPPADGRTPEALGKLVGFEIDKWVPLIAGAEITAN